MLFLREALLEEGVCARCAVALSSINGLCVVFRMEGVVREAVHGLKYGNLRVLTQPLGLELASAVSLFLPVLDRVIPVPLHPRRERERGYNQATLLAHVLAWETDLPLAERCLGRPKVTLPQARGADREQRRTNVAGAFACRVGLGGTRVLLIDDVCTTGATLIACAEALPSAGAASV